MLSMADDNANETAADSPPVKFDARLAEGVAYFEQMLEIMPEDRTTLEFLVVAYDQMGEHEKGQKALVSLTKLLIKENDVAALQGILPRLEASDYAPAKALALKVTTLTGPAPDLTPEMPKELTEDERRAQSAVAAVRAECDLVELLRESGVVTDDARAQLRAHLEASPADGRVFLISALQVLEKENPTLCEKAVAFLADRFGAPPVPLGAFETDKPLVGLLPPDLVQMRGVVPFARLGNLTLVATLNPADARLKSEVEALGPCRFYLADPASVEAAIEKVFGRTA